MAIAILDIDGTLVDADYHHAVAWYRAFREQGFVLALWRIHRHIGMGGDRLVPALIGERAAAESGEQIRELEHREYQLLIDEVAPMDGSRRLLEELLASGHEIVLASSARADEVDHYLDLLEARDLVRAWTTGDDVGSTKPAPDLVHSALARVDGDASDAVMVGDTPWDIEAAWKAQVATIAVRTGGFGHDELREAGALTIFESVVELTDRLEETPLRRAVPL